MLFITVRMKFNAQLCWSSLLHKLPSTGHEVSADVCSTDRRREDVMSLGNGLSEHFNNVNVSLSNPRLDRQTGQHKDSETGRQTVP